MQPVFCSGMLEKEMSTDIEGGFQFCFFQNKSMLNAA